MLYFYLRRALRSLRRTPGLSCIMVVDMALGLSIWVISHAAISSHTRDPLDDSSALFHVDFGGAPAIESVGGDRYQRLLARAPHSLLSYEDARRLASHPDVARSARTFGSRLTMDAGGRPTETGARFCTHELFSLFELPFRHGGPWDAAAERAQAPVVVLDHDTNGRLFGGADSVGRILRIGGQDFRVTGVLAKMVARLHGYDFALGTEPAIYLPFEHFASLGARPDFAAPFARQGARMADLVASGEAFVQLWVELPSAEARDRYATFLHGDARARTGVESGRGEMLVPLARWLEDSVAVPSGFFLFAVCAFIALLTCSVNLSRLLIVKFQGRAQELAIQRAVGATRMAVFAQHMLEAMLIALAAIALALAIAWLSLFGINVIVPDRPAEFTISAAGVGIGTAVGLGLGLLAGVPPAWRMACAAPAAYLRLP
jgi:putative ABC transport system permease protein